MAFLSGVRRPQRIYGACLAHGKVKDNLDGDKKDFAKRSLKIC